MQVYLFFALVFSICIAVFAVQNATKVDINFFFWQLNNVSLVLVIFGSALVGSTIAGFFGLFKQLTLKRNLKKHKILIDEQKNELDCCRRKHNLNNTSEETKEQESST